jgi:HPt (histidine-containing phosphotransfer) domain-containing protein
VSGAFDRRALAGKFGGDEALVRGLLEIALRTSRRLPGELRDASARGDCAGLARLAHTVKGTAGDLVAVELCNRARDTERAARESNPTAPALGVQLADAVDVLLADLQANLSKE